MRKLSKLKLKEFQEMSRFEMKNVVGGYTESSWCHEGEYLFHCVADFVGPVYGDPETTVDLGAVCARDRIDACLLYTSPSPRDYSICARHRQLWNFLSIKMVNTRGKCLFVE